MVEAFLKKINSIKDFGSFVDYKWDADLAEFSRYNLIYGWNGSGKTTLSRILRCYETGQLPEGRANASVSIKCKNNSTSQDDYSVFSGKIKVFNRDYISKNIHWEQGSAKQLIYVGEQQIEDKKALETLQESLTTSEINLATALSEMNSAEKTLGNFATNKAKEIKDHLSWEQARYTRTHLNKDLDNMSEGFATERLSEKEVIALRKAVLATNDKSKQNRFTAPTQDIEQLAKDVVELVTKNVSADTEIDDLRSDSDLNEWARKGHKLHEHRSECAYCDSKITEERRKLLDAHFNKEQEELLNTLEQKKQEIANILVLFKRDHDVDSARLFTQFVESYETAKSDLNSAYESLTEKLKMLTDALADKQRSVDAPPSNLEQIQQENWASARFEYDKAANQINESIDAHNSNVDNFDKELADAQESLKSHYLIGFQDERKALLLEQTTKKSQHSEAKKERDEFLRQIRELEAKQSNVANAAERINYLLTLMGHPHIRLEPDDDGYQLLRNGYKADDNLSEGEKTAITFAHFIASLGNQGFKIEDSIIVIDDPISSLDSNVLYSVFAVIKAHTKNAKQLFLMTHHHGFFTLLLSWIKHERKQNQLYYVQRQFCDKTGQPLSSLCAQDKFLQKYDSEYHYLFAILYKFEQQNAGKEINLEDAYPYLNIARKLLEIFLKFKYPDKSSMSGAFNELEKEYQNDVALIRKVRAIAMDGSHAGLDSIHELPRPLSPDNAKSISKVTGLIKIIDSTHWDRLYNLCAEEIGIIEPSEAA